MPLSEAGRPDLPAVKQRTAALSIASSSCLGSRPPAQPRLPASRERPARLYLKLIAAEIATARVIAA